MKTRKMNRYYCDFCKKSGGSKYWMEKHEKHCTANPDRECRMCYLTKGGHPHTKTLLAMLPDMEKFRVTNKGLCPDENGKWSEFEWDEYPGYQEAVEVAFKRIREETENCPACLLAVIRQSQIIVEFDFKVEKEKFWTEYNKEHTRYADCY